MLHLFSQSPTYTDLAAAGPDRAHPALVRRSVYRATTRNPRRRARGEASAGSSSGNSGD